MPLFQSESKCETFHMKMGSARSFFFMQTKVIFIRMVSHLDSPWNRGTRELGKGLLHDISRTSCPHYQLTGKIQCSNLKERIYNMLIYMNSFALRKCKRKFECILYEMLFIQNEKPPEQLTTTWTISPLGNHFECLKVVFPFVWIAFHTKGIQICPCIFLRTFVRNFSNIDFFSENFTIERWWVSDVGNVKKNGESSFWREHIPKCT